MVEFSSDAIYLFDEHLYILQETKNKWIKNLLFAFFPQNRLK